MPLFQAIFPSSFNIEWTNFCWVEAELSWEFSFVFLVGQCKYQLHLLNWKQLHLFNWEFQHFDWGSMHFLEAIFIRLFVVLFICLSTYLCHYLVIYSELSFLFILFIFKQKQSKVSVWSFNWAGSGNLFICIQIVAFCWVFELSGSLFVILFSLI